MPTLFWIIFSIVAILLLFYYGWSIWILRKLAASPIPDEVNKFILDNTLHLRTSVNTIFAGLGIIIFILAFLGYNIQGRIIEEVANSPELQEKVIEPFNEIKSTADTLLPILHRGLESLKHRGFVSASTIPGKTEWIPYNTPSKNGITVSISTEKYKFETTPIYVPVLNGLEGHWQTIGSLSVYKPSPQGFQVYVYSPEGDITPEIANKNQWHIQWVAIF